MASKVDSSGLSIISEERDSSRKHENSDDHESVYSVHKTRSAHVGVHKKKLHPLMLGPSRLNPGKISLHAASKNNLSEFTQRIMSAKLIRTKQVQNQLNETQNQLNELLNENRILRNLLKRQEGALKKYEGNHAELPQLIRSHSEEIRALKANNKLIKAQLRESNSKLKDRENELESLKETYNKLKKLSLEKNLLEREKLQKKVEELQEIIKEQEEKIQVLSRKVLLESKNYRHHLNIETIKHKETQKDLSSALSMINKLEKELMNKDKQLPNGKTLLKRESKNLMPVLVSKSSETQPKLGASEDSFLSRDEKRKSQIQESPEPELELLNCLESSEETPSPMQDIFPEINGSKKPSPAMKTTTEITFSKSEVIHMNNDLPSKSQSSLKSRKNTKKNFTFSRDPELNAKALVESLSEDMKCIDNLAQKVQLGTLNLENKTEVNSLFEELKNSSSKVETVSRLININQEGEDHMNTVKSGSRRNVPKRKLEEKETYHFNEKCAEPDSQKEFSKLQQQKLDNMTKTWNSLKSKIKEDRVKAEKKIKELEKLNGNNISDESASEEDNNNIEEEGEGENDFKAEETSQELKFVNFTDDAYILEELEKTDKIFKKLKNNSKPARETPPPVSFSSDKKTKTNSPQKPKPKPKPKDPPDIKSFRTESQRQPKYLEEFQKEYQKQNLLKALKAIDVGKDPISTSDESDESDSEVKKGKQVQQQKKGLKHVRQISSESEKGLMAELFGSNRRLDKIENLEYGTVASIKE